jgi:hypothetical protein
MEIITLKQTDTNATLIIPFEDTELNLRFKYLVSCQIWIMDIQYKDKQLNGLKLSCGVNMLRGFNLPFDFIVENNLNNGFDPYLDSDLSDGSYSIYLLDRAEMNEIRGYEVE